MPPKASSCSPVAVTMMSASSSWPDVSRMPFGVNVSIVSVTIEACALRSARNRSPSGTKQSRWSHGS